MTYKSLWKGKTDATDGTAVFIVNKVEYSIHLDGFDDFQNIEEMLHSAFADGRECAEKVVRSHISRALDDANRAAI